MKTSKILAVVCSASVITGFAIGTVASAVTAEDTSTPVESNEQTKQSIQEHFNQYDSTPEGKRQAFTSLVEGIYSECLDAEDLDREVSTIVDNSLTSSVPTITQKIAKECYGYEDIGSTKIVESGGIVWHIAQ